jgi:hypothetical protein
MQTRTEHTPASTLHGPHSVRWALAGLVIAIPTLWTALLAANTPQWTLILLATAEIAPLAAVYESCLWTEESAADQALSLRGRMIGVTTATAIPVAALAVIIIAALQPA